MTANAITRTRVPRTQDASSVRIPKLDELPMGAAALSPVIRDRARQTRRNRYSSSAVDAQRFFKVGDVVRAQIDGLGVFANCLVEGSV
jgi:2-keto-4-pentenoate hydratase/2-oxohepta-3-ene-1,7-dioic acid hydratase in catechol pathway